MTNNYNELCKTCKYRTKVSLTGWSGANARDCCFYIVHTGRMRGCDAKDCTKYEKGNPKRTKQAIYGGFN